MKIVRLKRGYRISLSDTEFEALSELVEHGQSDFEGDGLECSPLPARVKRILTDGRFALIDAMAVDEDRRIDPSAPDPQDGRFLRSVGPLDGEAR